MFVDETWASTNMARRQGRSPRGERLRISVPHGHWKTTTVIAGLRTSGIMAPFVIDGAVDRCVFETWVQKVLLPELRPGDIVVMDNLSSHKGPRVQEIIRAAGAELRYLPPYKPILQPHRGCFRQTQSIAAERGRTHCRGVVVCHWPPCRSHHPD